MAWSLKIIYHKYFINPLNKKIMKRSKKTSEPIILAKKRSSGIKSIDGNLDLGDGLSVSSFDADISETEKALEIYNEALSDAEAKRIAFIKAEDGLREKSLRFIRGIESKFGSDSIEFGKAGGVRKSDRKHPVRKTKAA
jgi:hypothetical protein